MSSQILTTLGGLGLFLMGMVVMTEGLKALAGEALHAWLTRFTHSPTSGAVTGTVATAILQSSSATTVTAVGFVAAGLMTFPQALGIILGANLGTTITGWMVALFGFKLKIGSAALPVIFVGAMLRIFGRGRWAQVGQAIAGFGVIFLGIGFTQEGMAGFTEDLTPERFPRDTWPGRLTLVGLGTLITMITRSSSAGVAMALTALSVGAVNFPQAAAMVIGMDVGTTITAVIATIGSSEAAKRTGWSHTVFNLFTAIGALILLDPYLWALQRWRVEVVSLSPELALTGFHTLFNLVALLVALPLTKPFARLMEKLVPERGVSLARRLDRQLLREPVAAMAALEATLADIFGYLLEWLGRGLLGQEAPERVPIGVLSRDLDAARGFLDQLNSLGEKGRYQPQIGTAMHALDHLQRMFWRMQQHETLEALLNDPDLKPALIEFRTVCAEVHSSLVAGVDLATYRRTTEQARELWESAEALRDRAIEAAVAQDYTVAETGRRMAGHRWLQRMAHHVWRVSAHLGGYDVLEGSPAGTRP